MVSSLKSRCAIPGCFQKNQKKLQQGHKMHQYSFPRDPARRELWLKFVNRINPNGTSWEPTKHSFICSFHFIGGVKSCFPKSPAFNPSLHLGQEATLQELECLKAFNESMRVGKVVKPPEPEPELKDIALVNPNNDKRPLPTCVGTQCDLLWWPLIKKCSGVLTEFSSNYSVEFYFKDPNSRIAELTFNQCTQVTHEKEMRPGYEPLLDSTNTNEGKPNLRTYSKRQQFLASIEKAKSAESPQLSPSTTKPCQSRRTYSVQKTPVVVKEEEGESPEFPIQTKILKPVQAAPFVHHFIPDTSSPGRFIACHKRTHDT